MTGLRHVGLDVHAATVSVAIAEDSGSRSLGKLKHDVGNLLKLLHKLGPAESLRVVYEAGPTGYALCRELRRNGFACDVIAPTLVPVMTGDRVKTDRRDALKLAELARADLLTPVWVPDEQLEALRDLVRAREAAKGDQLRQRHRLSKFLLRHGRRKPEDMKSWTSKHMLWVEQLRFNASAHEVVFQDLLHELQHAKERVVRLEKRIDEELEKLPPVQHTVVSSLQALRGIRKLTALTIVTEVGDLTRFGHPTQLMAYAGLVPREHSSGDTVRRGAITKTGNAHLRRVIGEAAWAYRFRPAMRYELRRRQRDLTPKICEISWAAQNRLHHRYRLLLSRGKHHNKVLGAVARELLGFVWAVGVEAAREANQRKAA